LVSSSEPKSPLRISDRSSTVSELLSQTQRSDSKSSVERYAKEQFDRTVLSGQTINHYDSGGSVSSAFTDSSRYVYNSASPSTYMPSSSLNQSAGVHIMNQYANGGYVSNTSSNRTSNNLSKSGKVIIERLAEGGLITQGSGTRDDVPAILTRGEYVIPQRIVNTFGPQYFDSLVANHSISHYKDGGYTGSSGTTTHNTEDSGDFNLTVQLQSNSNSNNAGVGITREEMEQIGRQWRGEWKKMAAEERRNGGVFKTGV
jgi:hypothetical protein